MISIFSTCFREYVLTTHGAIIGKLPEVYKNAKKYENLWKIGKKGFFVFEFPRRECVNNGPPPNHYPPQCLPKLTQSGGLVCPKGVVEGWHYKSLLAWRSALFSAFLKGVVLALLDNSIIPLYLFPKMNNLITIKGTISVSFRLTFLTVLKVLEHTLEGIN